MAIRINGVKSSRLSEDRKEVIVASTGKYTGDLELRFALECVDDLITALTQARSAVAPATAASIVAPTATKAVPAAIHREPLPKAESPAGSNNPDEVRFEIPRNCTITADTSGRGLVLFIVNHKLDRQAGYAFSPDAAKQLAGGLLKSAEAVSPQPTVARKN